MFQPIWSTARCLKYLLMETALLLSHLCSFVSQSNGLLFLFCCIYYIMPNFTHWLVLSTHHKENTASKNSFILSDALSTLLLSEGLGVVDAGA
jgi:hypothetical protein